MIINRPGNPLLHVHVYTMRLHKYSGEFLGENLFFHRWLCIHIPVQLRPIRSPDKPAQRTPECG